MANRQPIPYRANQADANIVGSGMIQPGAHPDAMAENNYQFHVPSMHDAYASVMAAFGPSPAQQAADDRIAKFRGEKAYYEGSPSKTKGALAVRMAGR